MFRANIANLGRTIFRKLKNILKEKKHECT
jgi:hypothetical protein